MQVKLSADDYCVLEGQDKAKKFGALIAEVLKKNSDAEVGSIASGMGLEIVQAGKDYAVTVKTPMHFVLSEAQARIFHRSDWLYARVAWVLSYSPKPSNNGHSFYPSAVAIISAKLRKVEQLEFLTKETE